MGAAYTHRCDRCGYSFHTSGPWEFYRADDGSIRPYGHPAPLSAEAAERGVHGLLGKVYCPACDQVREVVLVEFTEPCRRPRSVWLDPPEPLAPYSSGELPACPGCGGTRLVLGDEGGEGLTCPRCGAGRLVATMDWIS